MKASEFFVSTLKEAPADAEVVSHKLMIRSGMIKRLSAGIYTYMPMGLRVIRKVEAIIRQEMNRAGAIELLMPVVQPAELWQETGRFEKMGPELLRLKDRHDRSFIVQPTSEEVITDIARQELRSYRALPKNFYHIQTKFRDERRPRFGLMRGREFTMKDAYSFDRDAASAAKSYDKMYAAYTRIFERLGLRFRAVAADTGAIGGDRSHEFQVLAETGEDAIAYCAASDYAANIELAEAVALLGARELPTRAMVNCATPAKSTCEDVAAYLGVPIHQTVKSLVLAADEKERDGRPARTTIWLLLIRGDHTLNEVKVGKIDGLKEGFRFATQAEIEVHFGCSPGFLGPVGIDTAVKVVADRTVARMSDFICGANLADCHLMGVNWGRDAAEPEVVADIRNVVAGDPSPDGKGVLALQRGIEVGHVFFLGTKYSQAMNASFLDESGKPRLLEMGCYGIGVTRILGAAIEQSHDERGIVWPAALALHDRFEDLGVDVIVDDRGERPGAMFADWELTGVPHRFVVSERGLAAGKLEYQGRTDTQASPVDIEDATHFLKAKLAA
jgi:prolyl-tRNA synthetase